MIVLMHTVQYLMGTVSAPIDHFKGESAIEMVPVSKLVLYFTPLNVRVSLCGTSRNHKRHLEAFVGTFMTH